MNMKTSFIAAAVALATVYSFSVSAVQKDITVTANIDSTLELLQADGSSLPSTMKLDFMPGISSSSDPVLGCHRSYLNRIRY